jgi:PAS domain S-box-containing protein
MKALAKINQLLDVPSMDPDDARRRKLLNILLLGVGVIVSLIMVVTTIAIPLGTAGDPGEIRGVYIAGLGTLIGTTVIFAINRYGAGWLASTLFLILLTLAGVASDEPQQVAEGRSMIVFAIPIFMASILSKPWASFIAAFFSSLVIAAIQLSLDDVPNFPGMFIFFLIALVSWLAASGLERALKDLRTLNRELDQRVRNRTRELAESLSKTEAILESTADGIIVFDSNGKPAVANPAITNLLAHPADEIVNHDFETLMSTAVNGEDREMINNLLRGEEMRQPSVKFAWGRKTLSASVAPVHLESGEEVGTVAVFRDFTREAEIDRMKSTFVSIASHELRTPLNAIMGYTEMLQEGVYGELTDRQRGAMDRLMSNTSHMLGLVNNLLDRARIEAGTLTLNVSEFFPAQLVDGVIGVMSVMAQNKGLKLTSHIADDVPTALEGDWQRLHQILINFVNNAIKFTEEGSVDIRLYMAGEDRWVMAVADTGIGIPEDAQSYIFDPFRQVDDSATREYGGAGLGLSIVKQLVEMMGGRIELESEVGKGSTFTVILPLTPPVVEVEEEA